MNYPIESILASLPVFARALPGIKFYSAQGYKGEEMIEYTLPNGLVIKFLPMGKTL